LSKQDKRLTEIIQTHTQRVNKIIEDILQASRRQPPNRKKIELDSWLEDYLHTYTSINKLDKNLFLIEVQGHNYIFIDPDQLRQILDNLCNNALKYGRQQDGLVIFRVARDQQSLFLDVIDNGSGVAADKRKHLFEPFFTTSTTGTGLGLYISKEIAELNQANLSYQTTKTGGSCFRLRLSEADNNKIKI
jgi:two-component system sensor histidine kinase PilS (NtrC family)